MTLYNNTFTSVKKILPDCGNSIVNHLLNAMAITGVIPLWYSEEFACSTSPAIDYHSKHFGLPNSKEATRNLYKALCHVLPTKIDLPPSIRLAENVGCNVYRNFTGKDKIFHDIVIQGQLIYIPDGDVVDVIVRDIIFQGGVLDKFSWGKRIIDRWEFIERIKEVIPKSHATWSVPKAIMGNASSIEFATNRQFASVFSD